VNDSVKKWGVCGEQVGSKRRARSERRGRVPWKSGPSGPR